MERTTFTFILQFTYVMMSHVASYSATLTPVLVNNGLLSRKQSKHRKEQDLNVLNEKLVSCWRSWWWPEPSNREKLEDVFSCERFGGGWVTGFAPSVPAMNCLTAQVSHGRRGGVGGTTLRSHDQGRSEQQWETGTAKTTPGADISPCSNCPGGLSAAYKNGGAGQNHTEELTGLDP